jgi:phosphoglycerol transferase MdoB-like AlkP superfamily enzyme
MIGLNANYKKDAHLHWLGLVFFYAGLANLPYWAAAEKFVYSRQMGWFCTEYMLIGLLALLAPPIVPALLLLLLISLDLLCAVCETYNIPINVCLSNLGVVHTFTLSRAAAAIAILLLALAVCLIAMHLPGWKLPARDRWRAAACLLAFAGLGLFADFFTVALGTGHIPNPLRIHAVTDSVNPTLYSSPRLARIPIVRLVHLENVYNALQVYEKASPAVAFFMASASSEAIRSAGITAEINRQHLPNLVIVLVESWGLSTDPALNQALLDPYRNSALLDRYQVVQGAIPFHGATIAGEARELCGSAIGFHLLKASASELQGCLPGQLASLGYHTIALHGMNGGIFDRSSWYRTIGFQELWFKDRFEQQGLANCIGAFVGTCDSSIASWIGRRLEEPDSGPKFIHWMTLNSHLPVMVPTSIPQAAPCLSSLSLEPNSTLCSWYQLIAHVHQSVATLAMDGLARPTVFVIVGDHAPPFVNAGLRSRFSPAVVPYVLLIPRPADQKERSRLITH